MCASATVGARSCSMKWSGTKNEEYPSASALRACSVSSLPDPHLGAMTANRNLRSCTTWDPIPSCCGSARGSPTLQTPLALVEIGYLVPLDRLEVLDHELGDAVAATHLEQLGGIEIHEQHA